MSRGILMYRRNIIHLLVPLAAILLLFVAYQLFVKTRHPVHSPVPDISKSTEVPAESSAVSSPPPSRRPEEAPSRSLEYTTLPQTDHSALLDSIRDDIERGNVTEAEHALSALPASTLSNRMTKSFVAILWNNLGLQHERRGGPAASVKAFQRAAALDEQNATIQLNLAHAYWAQRDPALTVDFLTRVASLAPDDPFPHLAMADLLCETDQLSEATMHLTHAAARIKNDVALHSYLQMVTAKIRRAETHETQLAARSSPHFVVKFDGTEDPDTWTAVLGILEEAYRDIGQQINHFPSAPVVVVLHTKDAFQRATGSPAWADGLFDPVLGRIHVPTQGATTDLGWLKHVLRHEYAHAVVHDRMGRGGRVPTWLNEGLAMELAGNRWPDLDQLMSGDTQVVPLQYLEGSWGRLPPQVADLAYLEAISATHYLIERWGMSGVDRLLTAFRSRESVESALESRLFVSYDQFQSRWLEQFRQKHT